MDQDYSSLQPSAVRQDKVPETSDPETALEAMRALTDDERHWVFGHFCRSCGSADTGCQCWNDE